jgi:signal transduction histidine kinase
MVLPVRPRAVRQTSRSSHIRGGFASVAPAHDVAQNLDFREVMSEAQAGVPLAHAPAIRSFLRRFRTEILASWRRIARNRVADRKRIEEELHRAVAARDEVLAIVSHDLRNPLGAVHLSTTLLGELGLDERARKHLEMIRRATRSMSQLIDDLLDTAIIDAGKLALDLRPEPVAAVMAELRKRHEPLARDRGVELRATCELPGVAILCDRGRVLQVFDNLVSNAFKFCRAGDAVSIACQLAGGDVEFSVADTGPGIDPELVPYLFDPYWSAPQHTRHGIGLGLYIARGIVERHGGRIWVESRPGAGAVFSFTLPWAR